MTTAADRATDERAIAHARALADQAHAASEMLAAAIYHHATELRAYEHRCPDAYSREGARLVDAHRTALAIHGRRLARLAEIERDARNRR